VEDNDLRPSAANKRRRKRGGRRPGPGASRSSCRASALPAVEPRLQSFSLPASGGRARRRRVTEPALA